MRIPIRKLDLGSHTEKETHDSIVTLVEKILVLNKEHQALDPAQHIDEMRSLDKRIAQVDAEIDRQVYALYNLTEEEIRIVEGR